VVYFPGDGVLDVRSSEILLPSVFDFIVKSHRAFLYPIYKGTFERGDRPTSSYPVETNEYKERVIEWAQDLMRSVDYLETRSEVDANKLAYFGFSWGGRLGGIMLAIEPRFKAAVLNVAGLRFQKAFPEVEPINFIPRITIPVLMLNGRYDYYFPVESSQNPMFDLLGTPPASKRHVVADGSHFVPRPLLIKETLDWLDQYLGPVK
jgi:eukaryotic-like serine/threonine-protein kinase